MTEPTDDEILEAVKHLGAAMLSPVEVARAVLAKWGTPPAGAGEPIGHLYCGGSYGDELADWEIVADQHQCDKLNEHHGAFGKEAKLPLYTTPQPTQAQAGAVPLTPEQAAEIADAAHREYDRLVASGQCAPRWSAVFAHLLEQHHGIGIKGGQHGA